MSRRHPAGARIRTTGLLLLTALFSALACSQTPPTDLPQRDYAVDYSARFQPELGTAAVSIGITQRGGRLRLLDFNAPASRYYDFSADGEISRSDDRLLWQVPADGGEIRFQVQINQLRGNSYDALITDDWAVLRLDDLFPPARVRSLVGSGSQATVMLSGPEGWSFETGYGRIEAPRQVDNPKRRFVRPVGWLAAGKLGVRRDLIGERRVVVAAPVGESFRRLDILSFLNWTLADVAAVFPALPERILVVGGNRDMWRGALSGPRSLYLHPDRPLISENATSTLLHELVHVAMTSPPAAGDDWIAEGLAEYYSLLVLRRSGGISEQRYQAALLRLQAWVDRDHGRLADPSTAADTAYAALLFAQLDSELLGAGSSLDQIVGALFAGEQIDRSTLLQLAESALGQPSQVLTAAVAAPAPASDP